MSHMLMLFNTVKSDVIVYRFKINDDLTEFKHDANYIDVSSSKPNFNRHYIGMWKMSIDTQSEFLHS